MSVLSLKEEIAMKPPWPCMTAAAHVLGSLGGQEPGGSVRAAHGRPSLSPAADHACGGASREEQRRGGDPAAGGSGP